MESELMHNNFMTVDQYNLFQSQLQWYNELCLSQQNNFNQLCQQQLNQQKKCSICRVFKPYGEFHKHIRCKDGLRNQCKECRKETRKESDKLYRENNIDKIREYDRYRGKFNVNRRLLLSLRKRISKLLNGTSKNYHSIELLGCDIEFFRSWIEFQFTENMNWNSNIHLDHVRPCSSFNLSDPVEQKICFNWQNIQPLFAEDNLSKECKVNHDLIDNHKQKAQYFLNLYNLYYIQNFN